MNTVAHGGNGTPQGKGLCHRADGSGTGESICWPGVCVRVCAWKPGQQGLGKEAKV